jgi:hypothetical protein
MWLRAAGLAGLCIVVCCFISEAGGGKDKDKGKDKKFEVPKDAIAGVVKAVDQKKPSFTISVKGGKDRTFLVDKATEFWGPKGGDRGAGPDGLKDDTMTPGYEVKVVAAKDGKTAKDVYLPNRKTDDKDKKDKDKK